MIIFENVSKSYGDNPILEEVNLKVDEGEFVFLTGPSGAGKTTLLRMILREDVPDSGKILIDEEDILSVKKSKLPQLRRKVGFVFQDFKLLESKNSFENVSMSMEIIGKGNDDIQEHVPQILEMVGLKDSISKYPWQLSGGEKQRLGIARAVALEPKIIVADEPTGNLDKGTSWEILNLLNKINKDNSTTIIVATHDINLIDTLKKRVINLEEGRLANA